jgi:hypothetical protein
MPHFPHSPFVLAVTFGLLYACLVMPGWTVLRTFFEQASSHGYRSTVMKSLAWIITILFCGCLTGFSIGAPLWFCIPDSVLLWFAIVLYLSAYLYCLIKQPDALRSERYSLSKMAIEHGIVGDNIQGEIELNPRKPLDAGPSSEKRQIQ